MTATLTNIFVAAMICVAIDTIVRHARRKRARRCHWECLDCGYSDTTRARTHRQAWSWIGATTRVHATAAHGATAATSISIAYQLPREWMTPPRS